MGTLAKHPPILGRNTKVTAQLLPKGQRNKPVTQSITLSALAAKAATSLAVTALDAPIEAGQWLLFKDANGFERLAQVTVKAPTGATSVTIAPLAEAIANASVANLPGELWDRSGANIGRSYNFSEVMTLNTGGNTDGVVTGSNKTLETPGLFYHYNDAYRTCAYAAEEGREVWMCVEYEAPSDAYSKGETVEGAAVITDRPSESPSDGFISADLSFQFVGSVIETPATPVV